jgi:ClpP class serine protease
MHWFIDTGMRGGIKDRFQRSHVWTAYTDKKAFLQSCGIKSENKIQVLVVDRTGRILHAESGEYTKEGAARILSALRESKSVKPRHQ